MKTIFGNGESLVLFTGGRGCVLGLSFFDFLNWANVWSAVEVISYVSSIVGQKHSGETEG